MTNLTEKEAAFKELILKEEKESLANITKIDDKQMVAKINPLAAHQDKTRKQTRFHINIRMPY